VAAPHIRTPDVAVIGAGAWGRAIALHLAVAGATVRLLDDGGPATAEVAAGMLCPWSEHQDDGEDALPAALRASAELWPAYAGAVQEAAGGAPAGYRTSGSVYVASRPEHVGAVERMRATLAAAGRDVPWLDAAALAGLVPLLGPAVVGGVALDDEHSVDPRVLLGALDAALSRHPVERRMARISSLDDPLVATAGATVLATGATTRDLSTRVGVRAVKGQILTLAPRAGASAGLARIVRTPGAYLVPRADGSVVVGATQEELSDRDVTAEGVHRLLDDALRIAPALGEHRFVGAAAGLRPAAPDLMPVLGRDESGVIWATGGFRHGVLLLPVVVAAIAAAVSGHDAPALTAAFAPTRFGGRG
jgi:glycine oxidase